MPPIDRETFVRYWEETEIIRKYKRMLSTFGNMELPYIFTGKHHLRDRVVVMKGVVLVQKPTIIVPGYNGPQFREGFEHSDAIPSDAISFFRLMGLPYCNIRNRLLCDQEIEYGSLQSVLDKYDGRLGAEEDTETGLITGIVEGADVSLMRYSIGLAAKSGPGNIQQFMEHLRLQRDEPIDPDHQITDDDIRRLLE